MQNKFNNIDFYYFEYKLNNVANSYINGFSDEIVSHQHVVKSLLLMLEKEGYKDHRCLAYGRLLLSLFDEDVEEQDALERIIQAVHQLHTDLDDEHLYSGAIKELYAQLYFSWYRQHGGLKAAQRQAQLYIQEVAHDVEEEALESLIKLTRSAAIYRSRKQLHTALSPLVKKLVPDSVSVRKLLQREEGNDQGKECKRSTSVATQTSVSLQTPSTQDCGTCMSPVKERTKSCATQTCSSAQDAKTHKQTSSPVKVLQIQKRQVETSTTNAIVSCTVSSDQRELVVSVVTPTSKPAGLVASTSKAPTLMEKRPCSSEAPLMREHHPDTNNLANSKSSTGCTSSVSNHNTSIPPASRTCKQTVQAGRNTDTPTARAEAQQNTPQHACSSSGRMRDSEKLKQLMVRWNRNPNFNKAISKPVRKKLLTRLEITEKDMDRIGKARQNDTPVPRMDQEAVTKDRGSTCATATTMKQSATTLVTTAIVHATNNSQNHTKRDCQDSGSAASSNARSCIKARVNACATLNSTEAEIVANNGSVLVTSGESSGNKKCMPKKARTASGHSFPVSNSSDQRIFSKSIEDNAGGETQLDALIATISNSDTGAVQPARAVSGRAKPLTSTSPQPATATTSGAPMMSATAAKTAKSSATVSPALHLESESTSNDEFVVPSIVKKRKNTVASSWRSTAAKRATAETRIEGHIRPHNTDSDDTDNETNELQPRKLPSPRLMNIPTAYAEVWRGSNRKKKLKWTKEEEKEFIRLVRIYGEGNWSAIRKHHSNKERNNVHLKDKWRNLLKKGIV